MSAPHTHDNSKRRLIQRTAHDDDRYWDQSIELRSFGIDCLVFWFHANMQQLIDPWGV
jgi:hypothetical protein